jgi:hypothetical protein
MYTDKLTLPTYNSNIKLMGDSVNANCTHLSNGSTSAPEAKVPETRHSSETADVELTSRDVNANRTHLANRDKELCQLSNDNEGSTSAPEANVPKTRHSSETAEVELTSRDVNANCTHLAKRAKEPDQLSNDDSITKNMTRIAASYTRVHAFKPRVGNLHPPANYGQSTWHEEGDRVAVEYDSDLEPLAPMPLTTTNMDLMTLAEIFLLSNTLCNLLATTTLPTHGVEILMTCIIEATKQTGVEIVYTEELIESLELFDIGPGSGLLSDSKLTTMPLKDIIEEALGPIREKGASAPTLHRRFVDAPGLSTALDLITHGERLHMKENFTVNGGRQVMNNMSYKSKRKICNHAMFELVRDGKALAFSMDALVHANSMHEVHVSPLTWAPKADKILGRTCLDASNGTKDFMSLNAGTDVTAHDLAYPQDPLPTIADICELACLVQERNKGIILSGATVDVTTAYQQVPQSTGSAPLFATQILVPCPVEERTSGWSLVIVIFLVVMWGYTRAGHIYCSCSRVISFMHNKDVPIRSKTYIDDGMLIDAPSAIESSVSS